MFLINKKKYLMILAAIIVASCLSLYTSLNASAQNQPLPSAPAVPVEVMNQVISAIADTINGAFESLLTNQGVAEAGKSIAYSLFVIVLVWNLLKAMIQGDGINAIVAEMIPLIGTLAIVMAMLYNGGVGAIIKFLDSVAQTFGASGNLADDVKTALSRGFEAVANVLSMPGPQTNVPMSITDLGPAIGVAISTVVGLAAKLVSAFLIVIAIGIYIGNIILAYGSIMLALALAPIMVPFIMAPATSFIFDGWLRFTIGAGMIKVVGAFMLSFTDQLMMGLASLSKKVAVPANADYSTIMVTSYVVYAGLVLMAGLAAYLMMLTPQLASGLVSGSAGGAGFRGMRALTGGAGYQAMSRGAGASINAAGSMAGRGAKGVASGAAQVGHGALGALRSARGRGVDPKADRTPSASASQTASERYGKAGAAAYRALGGKTQ
ncbi:type IV secretion system protein [Acidovorax sp.]|jgi:type IV secretion system protein TrbL|uniref:type IV secretion system protein n=1 Tax=Acidovorax sp. TaxID=1872122 RepID=UPI0025C10BF1|nr:type IV secretion system protein [Acidovorax sp.]